MAGSTGAESGGEGAGAGTVSTVGRDYVIARFIGHDWKDRSRRRVLDRWVQIVT